SAQVTALRALLNRDTLSSSDGAPCRLVRAIQESRSVEAEISSALGEGVRRAVEHLIRASSQVIDDALRAGEPKVEPSDLYTAACRIVMRCVVILFAEARELLPRASPVYAESYGLEGLRDRLLRAGASSRERLRVTQSAWPQLLSLFRLIHLGSAHESLPVPRYGGALFRPGDRASSDPVERALAIFEDPNNAPTDA